MPAELTDGGRLTRAVIVDSAIAMIEADGVDALSMRKLAKRCGASPMALYRHVATKEELLRAVADHYLRSVVLPNAEAASWEKTITDVILAVYEGFEAHPHLAEIMAVQHVDAVAILRATELVAQALIRAGLPDDEVLSALAMLTAFATGYAQRSTDRRRRAKTARQRSEELRGLDPSEYPAMTSLGEGIGSLDTKARFIAGLTLVVEALRTRQSLRETAASP